MMAKRRTGIIYLLLLWFVITALAWPAFVLAGTLLSLFVSEGWLLDAWTQIPRRNILASFLEGYWQSLFIAMPLGLVAVVDYLLLSGYRVIWRIGGILLPASGAALAYLFFNPAVAALPTLLIAGLLLAIAHRLIDLLAGQSSRGRLR